MSHPENVFVVAGAFQLLNALEAQLAFQLSPQESGLVILEPRGEHPRDLLNQTLKTEDWSEIIRIGPPADSVYAWQRRVRRASGARSKVIPAERLFIGDYRNQIMRDWANRNQGEVIVLDDGKGTLQSNEHRRNAIDGLAKPPYRLQPKVNLAQDLAAQLLGLQLGHPKSVTFFTIYTLDSASTDRVIANSYSRLKSEYGTPRVSSGALFLGSPLVEDGIVDEVVYTQGVKTALKDNPHLRYAPHGREDPVRLERLLKDTGVGHAELPSPVELGLLKSETVPGQVYAFFTTALDTLPVLLPQSVEYRFIVIPSEMIAPSHRERVGEVYRRMLDDLRPGVEPIELSPQRP